MSLYKGGLYIKVVFTPGFTVQTLISASCVPVAEQALKRLQEVKLEEVSAPQQITEDLNVDPERDPVQYIAILVESLAMLRKMPEAIDVSI